MNWAGLSVAVGLVALAVATAPWGLLVLGVVIAVFVVKK
jgi:hypothetical protein